VKNGKLVLKMDKVEGAEMPNPDPPSPEPPQPDESTEPDQTDECPEPNSDSTCQDIKLYTEALMYGNLCEEKHDRSACGNNHS
jgi:hypothetical protein